MDGYLANVDQTNEYLNSFSERLKSKGRLPPTIESYRRDASRFLDYLAKNKMLPNRVEPDALVEYQQHLAVDCKEKENTVRRAVIGIRQFYRFLQEEKVIKQSPFDLVPIPERNETLPDFKTEDVEALIGKATRSVTTFISARNAAIVCLIGLEGLKATEIIALNWQDVYLDSANGTAVIRGTKARSVKLTPKTTDVLKIYKRYYTPYLNHPKIKPNPTQKVLVAFKGRDASVLIPHMTRHGLKFIVYEMGASIGMEHLNSEILRHYAVIQLISSGKTAEEIMDHLGLRRLGNIGKHFSAKRRKSLESGT